MWKIPTEVSKMYFAHGEKVEGAKLLPDGKRIMVGYGDGTMRLFDLKSGDVLRNVSDPSASHSPSAITALDVRSDNNLVASGGSDGMAKLFNIQSGKNVASFAHGKAASASSSDADPDEVGKSTVEAVLLSPPDQNILITGTLEGTVSIWDIASQVSRHSVKVGDGVVKMQWRKGDQSAGQILIATLHGKVVILDYRSGTVLGECSGHTDAILDFSQSEDGQRVVTASDDGSCKVFDIETVISAQ